MKQPILLLLSGLIMISCSGDVVSTDKIQAVTLADQGTKLIATDSLIIDQDLVTVPFTLLNIKDTYIVLHERKTNNFIHVFSLPDGMYLYSWGREGRGPGEFAFQPMYLFNDRDSDTLFISNETFYRMESFVVGDTSLYPVSSNILHHEFQSQPLEVLAKISDGEFIASSLPVDSGVNAEFVVLTIDNQTPKMRFGEYPSIEGLDANNTPLRFSKTVSINKQKGLLIGFYKYYDSFKIYNYTTGTELGHRRIDVFSYPDKETLDADLTLFRTIAHSTDDFIYTTGFGYNVSDIMDFNIPSTMFEVWNWNGESVYRATFDRPIFSYTVSHKYNKLFGFDLSKPNIIYVYDLPAKF
jgi:hypothetical protein